MTGKLLLWILIFLLSVVSLATAVVIESNNDPGAAQFYVGVNIATERKMANAFNHSNTENTTFQVYNASFKMNPTGTTNFYMEIQTDNAGEPSGTIVPDANTTVIANPTNNAFNTYIFPIPPNLTVGDKYWLVADSSTSANTGTGYTDDCAVCTAGVLEALYLDSTWKVSANEMVFVIKGEYPTAPPPPPAVDGNASFSGGINFNDTNPNHLSTIGSNATLYTDNSGGANITVSWYINDTIADIDTLLNQANNTEISGEFDCSVYGCTNGDLINVTYEGTVGNDKTNTSAQVEINDTGTITVYVYEKITGASLSEFNISSPVISATLGQEINITTEIGNITVTGIVDDYINTITNYTFVSFATNSNASLSGFYNTNLSIELKNAGTGANVQNYSGFINYSNGWIQNFSTNESNYTIGVIDGLNYTVFVDAQDYNVNLTTHEANGEIDSLILEAYKLNTLTINFYDQNNKSLIDDKNISLELISDIFSNNYTTDTGYMTIELLDPSNYTMRYYADTFTERFYYLNLNNNSYTNLSLYLIKEAVAVNITVTIIDETGTDVKDATVRALKYFIDTNSYIVQEVGVSNDNGEVFFDLTLFDEYYKFIVQYEGETVKTTNPSYLTSTSLTIQVILTETFAQAYGEYKNIQYELTYNDVTDTFRFTYNNLDGIASNICLYVYTLNSAGKTQINNSCSTSGASTLLAGITPVNDTIYSAEAYYYTGSAILITTLQKEFSSNPSFDNMGILAQILLTGSISILLFFMPELASILIPASLIFGRAINLTSIPYMYLFPLLVGGFIIAFIIGRRTG